MVGAHARGRRLIAVVLGAPSASVRTYHAARLLEQGFNSNWMTPSPGTVDQLVPVNAAPPDLREETCGPHRKRPAAEDEEVSFNDSDGNSPLASMLQNLRSPNPKPSQLLGQQVSLAPPVDVFVGTVKPGSAAAAAAQEDQIEQPKGKGKKGKLAKKKGAKGTDTASQDASETPTPAPAARAKPHRAKSATASSSDDTAAAGTTALAKPKAKKATVAAAPSDDSGAAASKSKPRPAKTAAPAGAANAISAPAKPASAQQ